MVKKTIKNTKIEINNSKNINIQSDLHHHVELIARKKQYQQSKDQILELAALIESGNSEFDKSRLIGNLVLISKNSPNALSDLYGLLKDTASGAAGGVAASWLSAFISAAPK